MQVDYQILEILDEIKILIVEDSKISREYLKKILNLHYKNVITAEDGLDGIKKFKEFLPSIIITDIRMPNMDGLTMIEELKKIHNHFYTIILSAHDEKEFLKDAISKGVYQFISKPIQIEELLNTIGEIKKIYIYQEKIKRQFQLIESILNSLEIIVVITNGTELFALNQYGLQFIGFSDLLELKKEHKCICEFFVNKEGYIQNSIDWLTKVKEAPPEQRKVIIQNYTTKENHIFSISLYDFSLNADYTIVLFYDITLLEKQKEKLKELATYDFLTGIYNRHHFHTILEFHIEKHKRYKELQAFGLLLMDLDHFKQINDTYGHLIGDEILKEFTELVKNHIRKSDFFARWGGEEFMILTTETTKEKLLLFAEKIRRIVEEYFSAHQKSINLTVSIGITIFKQEDYLTTLIDRADKALYLAKEKGRNRVEFL